MHRRSTRRTQTPRLGLTGPRIWDTLNQAPSCRNHSAVPVTELGALNLNCGHDDAVIVRFPDGTEVQATAAGRPETDPEPLFGLYLDRCWQEFGPSWDHVILDWPDFGVPVDLDDATVQIQSAFARAQSGERVEVGCIGGSGRTGTVLACMAILSGVAPISAVDWTRKAYKRSAVETKEQQSFVESFRRRPM
jgi:Protein-tyrosine phosphatase